MNCKKKPKNLHIPRCCPLCVRDGIRKVYKRIGDHVRRVHKLMGAPLKILLSEQRARTHRSKRPYYTCPFCGQYIINRSQHLVNVHHMEKTDIDYVVARSEFRKVEKDGDSHDENGLGNAAEEFPYLTRHYCLGLMPNARVMSCRRGFSIVDDYVTFIQSRLGGSVKPAEAKEARMKVNRFLALCGYTEGSDLRAVLCRKSIEVHNNYISRYHRPGTVRSAISNVKTFLKWLKDEGRVNSHVVDDAFRHLTCGLMSKNQDVRRREMECTALPASSSDSDSASSSDTDYASSSDSDYIPETEKSRITKAANDSIFSSASNPHANIGRKRVKVSFEETMEIKRCFMDEILQSARSGKTISINTVREKRTLHKSRLTDNQIREKVRNLVKVQKDFSQ